MCSRRLFIQDGKEQDNVNVKMVWGQERRRQRGMEKQHFLLSKMNPSEDNDTVGSVVSQASNHSARGKVQNYTKGVCFIAGEKCNLHDCHQSDCFPFHSFSPFPGRKEQPDIKSTLLLSAH